MNPKDNNKIDKYEKLYNEICELLGKKKDDEKFDAVKQLKELIKSNNNWKAAWVHQRSVTGLSYWNGYGHGFKDKEKGKSPLLIGRLATYSK